ncbi:MAG TPA: hypothetical protein VK861_05485 [Bacteroidales bacterium]|nr:hypothetical protein [Bacteroidales bacterium]
MRRYLIFILLIVFVTGCRKDKDPSLSGTVTIDNNLYGDGPYYAFGFSFASAGKVSTLENPPPDVTLVAETDILGNILKMNLQTTNFRSSFYRAGEYANASEARQAYDNLTSATVTQWNDDADAIEENQIWIFRSRDEKYAKFLITDTYSEKKDTWPYAECTFSWAYQPDGTLTFPGK